jgi:glycosyltransferase involved in cell wall biosynthesis
MPRLYTAATHYISLSHGEGWDQAMVEAAASGLTLIAPDHSAYRAYLDASVARMIPSREAPARFTGDPGLQALFAGASWWTPDEAAAAGAIRAAIEGRDVGKRTARARILSELTWERAARRLMRILEDVRPVGWRRFWASLAGLHRT